MVEASVSLQEAVSAHHQEADLGSHQEVALAHRVVEASVNLREAASANHQVVQVLAHHQEADLGSHQVEEVSASHQEAASANHQVVLVLGNHLADLANNLQEAVALDHLLVEDLANRRAVVLVHRLGLAQGMLLSNHLEGLGSHKEEEALGSRKQEGLRINHLEASGSHRQEEEEALHNNR